MNKVLLLLGCICFLTNGYGQEKIVYDDHAVQRDVPGFQKIEIAGSIDLYISNGAQKVAVSAADKEDVVAIETTVENGTLKIRLKAEDRWWKSNKMYNRRLKAYVSIDQLTRISLIGSGDVQFYQYHSPTGLDVRMVGSGGVYGALTSSNLNILQAGSGNMRISGSTEKLNVNLAGSGNISLLEFGAIEGVVVINGSGNVQVNISKSLEAMVNGSGNVNYKGAGQLIKSKIAGSGRIHKI